MSIYSRWTVTQYMRRLAQQEAAALRHLYAAHGRLPTVRPLRTDNYREDAA